MRENVCGNFYLRELIFADRWKKNTKIAKIRTRKNFVPDGIDQEILKEILEMGFILHLAI